MIAVAVKCFKTEYPAVDVAEARRTNELSLGFHRWPMISVYHIHLHCIYPGTRKHFWYGWLHPKGYGPLYVPAEDEVTRLLKKRRDEYQSAGMAPPSSADRPGVWEPAGDVVPSGLPGTMPPPSSDCLLYTSPSPRDRG